MLEIPDIALVMIDLVVQQETLAELESICGVPKTECYILQTCPDLL
jgi:hypothetical protein